MSTKVISAKIPSDDYDKLLDACNNKGCTISEFVRDRCQESINPNFESESKQEKKSNLPQRPQQNNEIEELRNKTKKLETELGLAQLTISEQGRKISGLYSQINSKLFCRSLG